MANYIIYFNQQWVGDHPAEWYEPRGPLARAVVAEMKEAGVLVFAGGLVEEIEMAFGADEDRAWAFFDKFQKPAFSNGIERRRWLRSELKFSEIPQK